MRRALQTTLIVLALMAVSGLAGYFATAHYQKTQTTKPAPVQTMTVDEVQALVQASNDAKDNTYKELVNRYDAQTTECEKGMVAYDKLTPFVQSQTEKPACAARITPTE